MNALTHDFLKRFEILTYVLCLPRQAHPPARLKVAKQQLEHACQLVKLDKDRYPKRIHTDLFRYKYLLAMMAQSPVGKHAAASLKATICRHDMNFALAA